MPISRTGSTPARGVARPREVRDPVRSPHSLAMLFDLARGPSARPRVTERVGTGFLSAPHAARGAPLREGRFQALHRAGAGPFGGIVHWPHGAFSCLVGAHPGAALLFWGPASDASAAAHGLSRAPAMGVHGRAARSIYTPSGAPANVTVSKTECSRQPGAFRAEGFTFPAAWLNGQAWNDKGSTLEASFCWFFTPTNHRARGGQSVARSVQGECCAMPRLQGPADHRETHRRTPSIGVGSACGRGCGPRGGELSSTHRRSGPVRPPRAGPAEERRTRAGVGCNTAPLRALWSPSPNAADTGFHPEEECFNTASRDRDQ